MTNRDPLYRRHRFPAEIIAHAVWLYFRFPLSLRMVEDMLAARGIIVSHQTVRLCGVRPLEWTMIRLLICQSAGCVDPRTVVGSDNRVPNGACACCRPPR